MCEAVAYLLQDGEERLILESVDLLESEGDDIRLVSLFGEEVKMKGKIKALSLVDHKIFLVL
jgi:predicted RNA-binding protein